MSTQPVISTKVSRSAPTRVLDITVLLGGPSNEREVSRDSGSAVAEALRRRGHKITESDISPQDTSALDRRGTDVVFIALHGEFGEDGQVQQLCEQRGLSYVGSGVQASKTAMDKVASKECFRRASLATPDWVVIDCATLPEVRRDAAGRIGLPCVVKPIDAGSSVGVTIAADQAARDRALAEVLEGFGRAMMERFVRGRELTVGILGEQALPVIEIRPARPFYDRFAKYKDDATQYIVNPPLPPGAAERLCADALTAHRTLGCRDLSRVDFILDERGVANMLEINTLPGFTSHSLLPKAAAKVGISFEQLVERIARMAMAR
jgi:D-alanine-D-alanine ligase